MGGTWMTPLPLVQQISVRGKQRGQEKSARRWVPHSCTMPGLLGGSGQHLKSKSLRSGQHLNSKIP